MSSMNSKHFLITMLTVLSLHETQVRAQTAFDLAQANHRIQSNILQLINNTNVAEERAEFSRYLTALRAVDDFRYQPGYRRIPSLRNRPCEFTGTVVFMEDAFLECPTIILRRGFTAIVTSTLYLHASRIYAEDGVRFLGRGESGIDGQPGHDGANWQTERFQDYLDSIPACDFGTRCPAPNSRTSHGTDGAPGGSGAIVIFSTQPRGEEISFDLNGGTGGNGGAAGKGGLHRYYTEETGRFDYHPPESHQCRSDAHPGNPGRNGNDGNVIVLMGSEQSP